MQAVVLEGIDQDAVERAVSSGAYARGAVYAEQRAVRWMDWDAEQTLLLGQVRGAGGEDYDTEVHFSPGRDALTFVYGDCACAVGFNCKHTVALALTARGRAGGRSTSSPGSDAGGWERSLGSLLDVSAPGPAVASGAAPLAVELTLSAPTTPGHRRPPRGRTPSTERALSARLVRPGKTGWVGGGLSWSALDSMAYRGDIRAAHVQLLQELYALHRSRAPLSPYFYGEVKTIDLAAFESRQLWSMLDEAAALGVELVRAGKGLGALDRYAEAELCLDVTRAEAAAAADGAGPLLVAPVMRVEGADGPVVPLRFIGAEGHGVVYVSPDESTADPARMRFGLARLARPVAQPLQRMATEGGRLQIPAGDGDRFRDEFSPRLRRQATIVSSDGSFTPPSISGPTLVLRAAYGDAHELDLDWEWSYRVGDAERRTPLVPGADAGFRDPAGERAVLDALDLPGDRFGPREPDPAQRLAPRTVVGGLETMRFTTEVLPMLADASDVVVEVSGEPAAYREAGDSLRIGVSADVVAGDTDWFDLGVSITVEGREVPFTDVFVALAAEETHLLLADGAFFSLQKPELASLRALIAEARAMQDGPEGPLRISRFQAGLWDELTEIGVVDRQATAWQRSVAGLLALDSVPATEPPPTLSAELRPYQRDGFAWLAFLWEYGLGGVLADDMGLGKTLQSLALICHARRADPTGHPFLIVAPTSVVANTSGTCSVSARRCWA